MSEEESTILDHINNIVVPGDVFRSPENEFWTLVYLRHGLENLNSLMLKWEAKAAELAKSGRRPRLPGWEGEDVEEYHLVGGPGPTTLLHCLFDWYSVTACNYVGTVGALAYEQDGTRPKPGPYTEAVIPEVYAYRNKVGAHFAWSKNNKRDNTAEREYSVFPKVSLMAGHYTVGSMTLGLKRSGVYTDSSAIEEWSLTEVHRRLTERYWPPTQSASDTASEPPADQGQQP